MSDKSWAIVGWAILTIVFALCCYTASVQGRPTTSDRLDALEQRVKDLEEKR